MLSLAEFIAEYFPPSNHATSDADGWREGPVPEWRGPADDAELIRKIEAADARNVAKTFGDKPTFRDLYTGNADALARAWPGEAGKPYGASEADQSLAGVLAFWTGKDCPRIERIMRASALARDKWDHHSNYLAVTIAKACSFTKGVYVQPEAGAAPAPPPGVVATPSNRLGGEYMNALDQVPHFDGCVFVTSSVRIWSTRHKALMPKGAFDVAYGGYLFVMDPTGQKFTQSAWDAFTLSRVNACPQARDICFRPEHAPGALVGDMVNTYVPYVCTAAPGDVSRFTDWLAKLLPVAEDRRILMNYLASMAQNPGVKFQWWPVLQGAEGNGKTVLIRLMQYVFGSEYSHLPNAHKMAKSGLNFTSWIHRHLFIGIEELGLGNNRDMLDELKVLVTNDQMEIEKKGVDQFTGDNRANGLILTNFRDGVPVERGGRRYAIFYTAQQSIEDVERDGMAGGYWPDFYDWLYGRKAYADYAPGLAALAHHLLSFQVEAAYDPAGLSVRAPETSSTSTAVTLSLGRLEQEVQEAIEQGLPGFCGGWVSSHYLDQLLERVRGQVTRNKRRDLMRRLGYDWHPLLTDGRTNDVVMPDGVKPKLYVRAGHLALNFKTAAEVANAYTKAQQNSNAPGVAAAFGP